MSRVKSAESALRLVRTHQASPQFICRACRQHARRQFHNSTPLAAEKPEKPFLERLMDRTFGWMKKEEEKSEVREEMETKKAEELAELGGDEAEEVTIDGKTYQVAPFVSAAINPAYVKASDWSGLEFVGGDRWAKKQLDKGEEYVGFAKGARKHIDTDVLRRIVFVTAVEALTLRKAERQLSDLYGPRPEKQPFAAFAGGQVAVSGGRIRFNENAEQELLEAIPDLTAKKSSLKAMQQPDLSKLRQQGRFIIPFFARPCQISLADAQVKLAIIKRVFQLTGKRISDAALTQATTMGQLMDAFCVKRPVKRVSQHGGLLRALQVPNVRFGPRKTWQKEREIGRWKLIVDELHKRNLPVRGTSLPGSTNNAPGLVAAQAS